MENAKRAGQRKYHYIYKTICLITNKFYIGMHSTDNLDDDYVGSGKRLWYSIRKYGKENHKKEIVEFLPDRKSLSEREKQIVNEELLADKMCMNFALGGVGGWEHVNNKLTQEFRSYLGKIGGFKNRDIWDDNVLNKCKKIWQENGKRNIKKLQDYHNEQFKNDNQYFKKLTAKATESAMTENAKRNKKATFNKINHQKGENNSQFNTCWIYNEKENVEKKISKIDISKWINSGWVNGRKKNKL